MKPLSISNSHIISNICTNIKTGKTVASERIKALILDKISVDTTKEEAQQIKLVAKLAIQAVQEEVNNGSSAKELTQSIQGKVNELEEKAKKFFIELTVDNRLDLAIISFHRQSFFNSIGFLGTSYTKTNQKLLNFIDDIESIPRVNFLSSLPKEISLEIVSYLTPTDQKRFRLVNSYAYELVMDEYNTYNPLNPFNLNVSIIGDKRKSDEFLNYLISQSCQITILNLSQINSLNNALRKSFLTRLLLTLKDKNTPINLDIAGCKLSDEELTLIGELIKNLPNPDLITVTITNKDMDTQEQLDLLNAKLNGNPKLCSALFEGNSGLVFIWAKIILNSNLTNRQKFELLAAESSSGKPGLFVGFEAGRGGTEKVDAVAAFTTLILDSKLTNEEKVRLLAAKNSGLPGLHWGLCVNYKVAIVFAKAVLDSRLNDQEKLELLAARNIDRIPALARLLENNYTDATIAFTKLVLKSDLTSQQKFELLAAKDSNGTNALYFALAYGVPENIAAFIKEMLESCLTDQEKFELMAAKSSEKKPGLFWGSWEEQSRTTWALRNHSKRVSVFTTAVLNSRFTSEQKLELLTAKFNGIPGLALALRSGITETVQEFMAIILASDITDNQKIELLALKSDNGVNGLFLGLVAGQIQLVLMIIRQLIEFGIDMITLNELITLSHTSLNFKLSGLLIAITEDKQSLEEFNRILSNSQKIELYQAIIDMQESVITMRDPLGTLNLENFGYGSSEKFWDKMSYALELLKKFF
jgi:hypothetical protein